MCAHRCGTSHSSSHASGLTFSSELRCVGVSLTHGPRCGTRNPAANCKHCTRAATSPPCLQLHDENMLMPDVFIGVAKTYLRQVSPTTFSKHPQGTTVAAHPGLSGNARVLQSGGSAQRQGISASLLDCVNSFVPKGVCLAVYRCLYMLALR